MKIGGAIGQSALVGALSALGACAISFPDYTEGPIGAGGAGGATASSSSSSSTSASSSSSSGTGGMGGASSSSSSSTSASSSASSSSGTGGQGECAQPADCAALPADDACQTRTCISTKCGQVFAPLNTLVPGVQTAGDCKVIECDGAGKQVTNADPTDLPNDNNVCTTDSCAGTTPVNTSLPMGTACGASSVCDGAPVNPICVGCLVATDCSGYVQDDCKQTTCSPAHVCGTAFTANSTPTSTQTAGNCQKNVCDGNGNAHDIVDNSDLPVDGNLCTQDICTSGVSSNPPIACTALDQCHAAGTCSAGVCSNPAKVNGSACNDGDACTQSDACQAGICSGSPKVCTPYACKPATGCLVACAKDADCAAGDYCTAATCVAKKANGAACAATNQCTSGFCADGFCCNTACTDACQACSKALTATADGTCADVVQGSAHANKCAVGIGGCPNPPDNCACNGADQCKDSDSQLCSASADCASGNCDTLLQGCRRSPGNGCNSNNDCASNNCVANVCQ